MNLIENWWKIFSLNAVLRNKEKAKLNGNSRWGTRAEIDWSVCSALCERLDEKMSSPN